MMAQPATEVARNFNTQLNTLADSLKESDIVLPQAGKQDKVSHAIEVFFQAIQQLPPTIAALEFRPTVLFEIDCALSGIYGSNLFATTESVTPVRKLLTDLAALWQRYYLILGLERLDGADRSIIGVSNFYDAWIKKEGADIDKPVYEILLDDVVLLLRSSQDLNLSSKVTLFSLMGKILATLGVSDEFAQDRLKGHLESIQARSEETSDQILAEILLSLQVLASRGKGISATNIEEATLQKAIRYWSARDEFLDKLFKSWEWHEEYDFTPPLAMGDQLHVRERSSLFTSWSGESARLGIGHSFLELMEYKRQNPLLTSVYQPIPIFMFGHSGVGKTSYLNAYCYNVTARAGRALALGRKLTIFYENNNEAWRQGTLSPTSELTAYDFWEDLNIAGYCTYDYGGKETSPEQWDQQFQDAFRNAKGLLFFIDENDYMDPARLKRRSALFETILALWINSNPQVRHVPIGIILTKCDRILAEQLKQVRRTTLIPTGFQPGLIEVLLPHRFKADNAEMQTPLGRLKTMILDDSANNVTPALQDIVQTVLDNFSQFLARVLDVTYNYQIFLTSSIPPADTQDTTYPWGVKEPLAWMVRVLERFHLHESLVKFNKEEKQIEDQIRVIKDALVDAQRLRAEVTEIDAEIRRLRSKPAIFQVTMEKRIKFYEDQKQKLEQDLRSRVQPYMKNQDEGTSSVAWLQAIEREENNKQSLLDALRAKRNDFTSRLKAERRS